MDLAHGSAIGRRERLKGASVAPIISERGADMSPSRAIVHSGDSFVIAAGRIRNESCMQQKTVCLWACMFEWGGAGVTYCTAVLQRGLVFLVMNSTPLQAHKLQGI